MLPPHKGRPSIIRRTTNYSNLNDFTQFQVKTVNLTGASVISISFPPTIFEFSSRFILLYTHEMPKTPFDKSENKRKTFNIFLFDDFNQLQTTTALRLCYKLKLYIKSVKWINNEMQTKKPFIVLLFAKIAQSDMSFDCTL